MESLSDIVAEMRTRSREVKEAFGEKPDGVENMLDIWADRIESAAKRGVVSKTETTTVGNAAAMREALDAALRFIGNLEIEPYSPLDEAASELRQRIMDALSAPARQCDVGTPGEQSERMEKAVCSKHHGCVRCPLRKAKYSDCSLVWAQTPYAEEGAGK